MKKFFVAANIVGTRTVTANSIQEAQQLAEQMHTSLFRLQPKPIGILVFDTENVPKEYIPHDGKTARE
jgi:hypothetical protein